MMRLVVYHRPEIDDLFNLMGGYTLVDNLSLVFKKRSQFNDVAA